MQLNHLPRSCNSRLEICKLLLEAGASTKARDDNGNTPLHLAARWGFEKIVALLLDHKANVFKSNDYGQTPWQLAQMNGHQSCANLLPEEEVKIKKRFSYQERMKMAAKAVQTKVKLASLLGARKEQGGGAKKVEALFSTKSGNDKYKGKQLAT